MARSNPDQTLRKLAAGGVGGDRAVQPGVHTVPTAGGVRIAASTETPSFSEWVELAQAPCDGADRICYDVSLDKLFVAGPVSGFSHLLVYDIATDVWTDIGTIGYAIDNRTAAIHSYGGIVACVSFDRQTGTPGTNLPTETRVYDYGGASWSTGAQWPANKAHVPAWSSDASTPYLYVIGGILEFTLTKRYGLNRYNVSTDTWTTLTNTPYWMAQTACPVIGDYLYVLGVAGYEIEQEQRYSISGDAWSNVTVDGTVDGPNSIIGMGWAEYNGEAFHVGSWNYDGDTGRSYLWNPTTELTHPGPADTVAHDMYPGSNVAASVPGQLTVYAMPSNQLFRFGVF